MEARKEALAQRIAEVLRAIDHEIATDPIEETVRQAKDVLADEQSMMTLIENLLDELDNFN